MDAAWRRPQKSQAPKVSSIGTCKTEAGMSKEGIHSALRIAAVIHAVAVTLEQEMVALQKAA